MSQSREYTIRVQVGYTPQATRSLEFKVSSETLTTMFLEKEISDVQIQDGWLMTLLCREIGLEDSYIWEIYARAAVEKKHPFEIFKEEIDLIDKLEENHE